MFVRNVLLVAAVAVLTALWSKPTFTQTLAADAEQVRRIQYLLLWTGHHAGPVDGRLDSALLASIEDFQSKAGYRVTAILDAVQIGKLAAEATRRASHADYTYLTDSGSGTMIALPRAIMTQKTPAAHGTRFAAPDSSVAAETVRYVDGDLSLLTLYKSYELGMGSQSVLQNVFRGDDFTLAWMSEGIVQMVRFHSDGREIRGLIIRFEQTTDRKFLPVAYAMLNDFAPAGSPGTALPYLRAPAIARFPSPDMAPPPAGRALVSSGTGFVVARPDLVLTNAHVVESCARITVGKDKRARLVAFEAANDLALLYAPGLESAKAASFAREPVRLGTEIAVFGYPLRNILANQLNMTTGIVSALAGPSGNARFIQVSAAVQPGNSGGPLVDLTGRIVGIVTARLTRIRSAAGGTGEDIAQLVNFAIRHDRAASFLRQNGVEAQVSPPSPPKTTTELASLVAEYTLPVTCDVQ